MSKSLTLTAVLSFFWHTLLCQPLCNNIYYDEDNGLPHSHVTQVLQDKHGFIWLSTWNGLCRYDGYDFQTFKPQQGDGCHMTTDRLRDICMLPDGNILCRVDKDYFLFDTRKCRFQDLNETAKRQAPEQMGQYRQSQSLSKGNSISWKDSWGTQWTLASDGNISYKNSEGEETPCPLPHPISHPTFACHDDQGGLWVLCSGGISRITTSMQNATRLPQKKPAEVKCLFTDNKQRIWVCTKEDRTIRLYTKSDGRLIGYLASDGSIRSTYTSFASSIYSIHQSPDGAIWLGSKPDGLFRLTETAPQRFTVLHITNLPDGNVYNIASDSYGRLWIATLGGGLCYSTDSSSPSPTFRRPANYPKDGTCMRVRFLHITPENILTAATTDGLLVSRLGKDTSKMTFLLHTRDANRASSLSSSATMDILGDGEGHLYISTESGGINIVDSRDIMKPQPTFKHVNSSTHQLPSDVTLSLTNLAGGNKMVVGSHVISISNSNFNNIRVLDSHFFNSDYRFSDAHPQAFGNGQWIVGLTDGAMVISSEQMKRRAAPPHIVLTAATIQGEIGNFGSEWSDTIILKPHERNITLHFAVLDYSSSHRTNHAFMLQRKGETSNTTMNYIGHDRSITLLDLSPGTYSIAIRSTDSDGMWTDNFRIVTIVVQPTFWQSWIGRLLLAVIVLGFVGLVLYTCYYIRRIKKQQHETLEAYLSLLNDKGGTPSGENASATPSTAQMPAASHAHINSEDDAMIKRLMAFIDENLGNSELRVADMASAAATSPSGLQRKLKHAMGVTPQDLLREARIKHACQLLASNDKSVSDVAYACGFSDPKYFSKCFKASIGKSPKEYKNGK